MSQTKEAEKEVLDPMLIIRLENMITERVISNDQLIAILNSLEKKGNRRQKKEKKKIATATSGENREYCLPAITGISYTQSEKVWGTWSEKEKNLPASSPTSPNPVFLDIAFNFRKVFLRGFSLAEMAKRFPAHNWGKYAHDQKEAVPGSYLISLNNPLVNRLPVLETELHPKDCYRLDLNLTVELLLTLTRLGIEVPALFYRTTVINGHQDELCVGLVEGKITFLSEDKVRAQKKMAICLAKYESWV